MSQFTTPRLRFQVSRFQNHSVPRPDLGLDSVFPEALVRLVLQEEGATWRSVSYTPWLTFWAFFWQVLGPDHSCRAAVKRIAAWVARRGGRRVALVRSSRQGRWRDDREHARHSGQSSGVSSTWRY